MLTFAFFNPISLYSQINEGTLNLNDNSWYINSIVTDSGPEGIFSADFNNDGFIDIVVANRIQNTISILFNDANGCFNDRIDLASGNNPFAVTGADIDNDNDIDLLATCKGSSSVYVYQNIGNKNFQDAFLYPVENFPSYIQTADLDGDEYVDVAVTCGKGYTTPMVVSLLFNLQDGTFGSYVNKEIGYSNMTYSYIVQNSTISKDGFELKNYIVPHNGQLLLNLTAIDTTHSISIPSLNMYQYIPVGETKVIAAQMIVLGDHEFHCDMPGHEEHGIIHVREITPSNNLSLSDIDNDSDIDILATNWKTWLTSNSNFVIFENDGSGNFTLKSTNPTGSGAYSLITSDLNADLYGDVIVANYYSNYISVYLNNQTGEFPNRVDYSTSRLPYSLSAFDFDGDNDQDIIAVIPNLDSITVFTNDGNGNLTSPTNYFSGKTPFLTTANDFDQDFVPDLAITNYTGNSISILQNHIPNPCFSLIYPLDLSTVISDTIRFDWNNLEGAIKYELYVDNNVGFGSPEISSHHLTQLQDLNETHFTISGNWLSENEYFWKVKVILPDDTIESAIHSFTYIPPKLSQPEWVPLYRAFHPQYIDHFLCSAESHLVQATIENYRFEGVEGFVSLHPFELSSPDTLKNIYRFYIPNSSTPKESRHYYTTSGNDRDNRIAQGWIYEGITGYGYNNCHIGLTKLHHTYLNQSSPDIRKDNFYTISEVEKNNSISLFNYADQGHICFISATGDNSTQIWLENNFEVGLGINPQNGNFGNYSKSIFSIPEGKVSLNFGHFYNSNSVRFFSNTDPLGNGWNHPYNISMLVTDCNIIVVWPEDIYIYNSYSLEPLTPGVYDELIQVNTTTFQIKKKDQRIFEFENLGILNVPYTFFLTSITDRNNNQITLEYNDKGWLKWVKSPANRYISFSYFPSTDDARYGLIHYVKDSLALNRTVTYNYDTLRNLVEFIDAKNNITSFEYESGISPYDHFLKTIIYPDGSKITNEYDSLSRRIISQNFDYLNSSNNTNIGLPSGNHVVVTDELNRSTGFDFDNIGNITQLTTASGNGTFEFDDLINPTKPTKIIDGKGYETSVTYDDNGNPLLIQKPYGIKHEYGYNEFNDLVHYIDPRNKTTNITYTNGNPTSFQTPRSTTHFTYFPNGNLHTITNPLNQLTTLEYDTYNNLNSITDNLNHVSTYSYDDASRITISTNANNQVTGYEYDANDLLVIKTDALNNSTQYGYDNTDRLTDVTDARNNSTGLTYDPVTGLLDYLTDQLGEQTNYSYYKNGLLQSITDRKGQTTTYTYDDKNRLDTVSGPSLNRTFIYDQNDNLTAITDNSGNLSFSYDSLNRLISHSFAGQNTVQYEYDQSSNITKIFYPGANKEVEYTYYDDNLLETVKDWNNNTTAYFYLDDGNLDSVHNANGTTTKYIYDDSGRLTGLVNRKSDGSIINTYSYTLDNIGNHLSVTLIEPLEIPPFQSVIESYSYDNANRIMSAGSTIFGFDENGNLSSKNDNGMTNFTWDSENRLTGISGQVEANYIYDALGNRRSTTKNGEIRKYVVDISGSMSNVLIETDNSGNPLYYYIYGLGLVSRIKANDNLTYYYHYDSRGSTIAITDQSENITHKYSYEAFGKVLQAVEPAQDFNPFRFVGKYGVMYEDSTLYFMRARYYNPKIGRFLSEDPIWDINRYSYAMNNPFKHIDPKGLTPKKVKIVSTKDGLEIYFDAIAATSNSTSLGLLNDGLKYSQAYMEISYNTWKIYERKKKEIEIYADLVASGDMEFDIAINSITKGGFLGMGFGEPIRKIFGTDRRESELRFLLSLRVEELIKK